MKTSVVMFNVNGLDKRDYTARCTANGLSNQVLVTVIVDITDDQIFEHFGIRAIGIKLQDSLRALTAERISEINKAGVYTCKVSDFVPVKGASKREDLTQVSTEDLAQRLNPEQIKKLLEFAQQQEALRTTAIEQVQKAAKK